MSDVAGPPAPARSIVSRLLGGNRFWFALGALVLIGVGNLFVFRAEFSALTVRAMGGSDPDTVRWQRWADHYSRLFEALHWNERIGIQIEGQGSPGFVVERTAESPRVWHTLFLAREDPGVILTFQPDTAEQMLASVAEAEPEAIWASMKDALYGRQITLWSDPDLERLEQGGYLKLMRAIDTRPPDHNWPEVKKILGEPHRGEE